MAVTRILINQTIPIISINVTLGINSVNKLLKKTNAFRTKGRTQASTTDMR